MSTRRQSVTTATNAAGSSPSGTFCFMSRKIKNKSLFMLFLYRVLSLRPSARSCTRAIFLQRRFERTRACTKNEKREKNTEKSPREKKNKNDNDFEWKRERRVESTRLESDTPTGDESVVVRRGAGWERIDSETQRTRRNPILYYTCSLPASWFFKNPNERMNIHEDDISPQTQNDVCTARVGKSRPHAWRFRKKKNRRFPGVISRPRVEKTKGALYVK